MITRKVQAKLDEIGLGLFEKTPCCGASMVRYAETIACGKCDTVIRFVLVCQAGETEHLH